MQGGEGVEWQIDLNQDAIHARGRATRQPGTANRQQNEYGKTQQLKADQAKGKGAQLLARAG